MNLLLKSKFENYDDSMLWKYRRKSDIEVFYPNLSQDKDAICDKQFFNDHHSNLNLNLNLNLNKVIDKKQFLEHMIPHHQVAIDMSLRLLKHTYNQVLIKLCNDIIYQQKYEIWYMKHLLNGEYNSYYNLHDTNYKWTPNEYTIDYHSKLF
jgi:hypothetical protein